MKTQNVVSSVEFVRKFRQISEVWDTTPPGEDTSQSFNGRGQQCGTNFETYYLFQTKVCDFLYPFSELS